MKRQARRSDPKRRSSGSPFRRRSSTHIFGYSRWPSRSPRLLDPRPRARAREAIPPMTMGPCADGSFRPYFRASTVPIPTCPVEMPPWRSTSTLCIASLIPVLPRPVRRPSCCSTISLLAPPMVAVPLKVAASQRVRKGVPTSTPHQREEIASIVPSTPNSLTRPCYPVVKLRSSSTWYTRRPRTTPTVPVRLPVLNGYSIQPSIPAHR